MHPSGARDRWRNPKPRLLFSDDQGVIRDHPTLLALGAGGGEPLPLTERDAIPLPRGSDLFYLPGRTPLGWNSRQRRVVAFSEGVAGRPVHAVAAFLAPAHTADLLAAYHTRPGAPVLPLYAYAAVGFAGGEHWAAARRVDPDRRQDPWRFDDNRIRDAVARHLEQHPENALVLQLERCALEYQCRAAQNFFLERHEAPLPISVTCNARCLGCISLQPDGTFKAAHERLGRAPRAEEVAAVAREHIARVPRTVVSFGQGCEGEPLLMRELIVETVRRIRAGTTEGTVNLNSNASLPAVVEELVAAGLDSLRVSLNSPRPRVYDAYYRPQGYRFADVEASMLVMRRAGRFVSLNLLYFPGVTDREEEIEALVALIESCGVRMIQLRNLNLDPEIYREALPRGVVGPGVGLEAFMRALQRRFPRLHFGYFNPPKEEYADW
ncbi:MAG: radical SAM protein [Candidatus Eisenbacteria sp.]|nr:radical SAM protein [Candidatus Eisenbacteria bacterium]